MKNNGVYMKSWVEKINKLLPSKIASKIISVFLIIFVSMVAMLFLLGFNAFNFTGQYNVILENVITINNFKTATVQIPEDIIAMYITKIPLADSDIELKIQSQTGYMETINTRVNVVAEDSEAQASAKNIEQMYIIYKERLGKVLKDIPENTQDMDYLTAFDSIAELKKISNSIEAETQVLLTLELDRSVLLSEEVKAGFNKTVYGIVIAITVLSVFGIFITLVMTSSITRAINQVKNSSEIIARGDLTGDEVIIQTKGEVKDLANSFNEMRKGLKTIIYKVSDVSQKLEESIKVVSKSVIENTEGSIQTAEEIDHMSARMKQQNDESKNAMEQVYKMGSISEKISLSVDRIESNANLSLEKAEKGNENVNKYVLQLSNVNKVMNGVADVAISLSESTKEMNAILSTMSTITSQTNLLSLNASIEAARVGVMGNGFAVVASEIRKLAEDSHDSASRISSIISAVQKDAHSVSEKIREGLEQLEKGNALADQTRASFSEIKQGTMVVSRDVNEILGDIVNLSGIIISVTDCMRSIDQATDENVVVAVTMAATIQEETANLEEVSSATLLLEEMATELEQAIEIFRI